MQSEPLKKRLKANRMRLERIECDRHVRGMIDGTGPIDFSLVYGHEGCDFIADAIVREYDFAGEPAAGGAGRPDGFREFESVEHLAREFGARVLGEDGTDSVLLYSMTQNPEYAVKMTLATLVSQFTPVTRFFLSHARRHQLFDGIFYLPESKNWFFQIIPFDTFTFVKRPGTAERAEKPE
jgi:hypothetical protein